MIGSVEHSPSSHVRWPQAGELFHAIAAENTATLSVVLTGTSNYKCPIYGVSLKPIKYCIIWKAACIIGLHVRPNQSIKEPSTYHWRKLRNPAEDVHMRCVALHKYRWKTHMCPLSATS